MSKIAINGLGRIGRPIVANLVPTSSGAAEATTKVLPALPAIRNRHEKNRS